ncbi:Glucose/ribitol dehydrogenase [Macrophomina phaseolina MS6]|uniref:Glucose/ribitol dehydrogenase n=1 Tax=Macrophomina phaseolina (strain MS6) TaxID=1126212 RepID=K2RNI2_MACPH|nr:Glucose/ribitol dehydrogenase [Macrophomina phaseolina MS6]
MAQAVLPHLRGPGRIINIVSVFGRIGQPAASLCSASEAAVEALSRGWASELGAADHAVNVLSPALAETDMTARTPGPGSEQMQKMMTDLEHRLGKAEDIALVIAMLAEPLNSWITGQTSQAGGGICIT